MIRQSWLLLAVLLLQCTISCYSSPSKCDPKKCILPNCRCVGTDVPGGLKPEDVPQMVLISFDDAVNWENWDYYYNLFPPDGNRTNPNGCRQSMTLFVSHNYTDYCMIRQIHGRGVEIAAHSVTHRVPHFWWGHASEKDLFFEITEQRNIISKRAQIPITDIKGWRSPFIQPTGDTQYNILWKNNFTYDTTLTYPHPEDLVSPVLWPFTLDYPYPLVCNVGPCPKKAYPGLWVIPAVCIMDHLGEKPCAYVDSCENKPKNRNESLTMLWQNFERNYYTNRAPLYLNMHSRWLNEYHNYEGLMDLLDRFSTMDDVFVVTFSQALEWVRSPTPLSKISTFQPWLCKQNASNGEDLDCIIASAPSPSGGLSVPIDEILCKAAIFTVIAAVLVYTTYTIFFLVCRFTRNVVKKG